MRKIIIVATLALLISLITSSQNAYSQSVIEDPRYSNTIAHMTAYITNAMAVNGIVGLSVVLVDSNQVV